jgi:hypothetical protein
MSLREANFTQTSHFRQALRPTSRVLLANFTPTSSQLLPIPSHFAPTSRTLHHANFTPSRTQVQKGRRPTEEVQAEEEMSDMDKWQRYKFVFVPMMPMTMKHDCHVMSWRWPKTEDNLQLELIFKKTDTWEQRGEKASEFWLKGKQRLKHWAPIELTAAMILIFLFYFLTISFTLVCLTLTSLQYCSS